MTYNHYFSRTHGRQTHDRGSDGEGDNAVELFTVDELLASIDDDSHHQSSPRTPAGPARTTSPYRRSKNA